MPWLTRQPLIREEEKPVSVPCKNRRHERIITESTNVSTKQNRPEAEEELSQTTEYTEDTETREHPSVYSVYSVVNF